jgi:hypothetical protein
MNKCVPSPGATRRYRPHFALGVRYDDASILHEIVARTGVGKIYMSRNEVRPNRHNTATWQVTRKDDLAQLVSLLSRYPLRAKKRRDFEIWQDAVSVVATCRQGMSRSYAEVCQWELQEIAERLESERRAGL